MQFGLRFSSLPKWCDKDEFGTDVKRFLQLRIEVCITDSKDTQRDMRSINECNHICYLNNDQHLSSLNWCRSHQPGCDSYPLNC